MSCRFLSDGDYLGEDTEHRKLRLLEVRFHNGIKAPIFVASAPPFVLTRGTGIPLYVWHYDLSPDGKLITLKGVGSDSVKVLGLDGTERAHETVTDWPLEG